MVPRNEIGGARGTKSSGIEAQPPEWTILSITTAYDGHTLVQTFSNSCRALESSGSGQTFRLSSRSFLISSIRDINRVSPTASSISRRAILPSGTISDVPPSPDSVKVSSDNARTHRIQMDITDKLQQILIRIQQERLVGERNKPRAGK